MTTWTDERVEILTTMWDEGASAGKIALKLGGVTRSAVLGKLNRMKLLGTRPPQTGLINYRQAMRELAAIQRMSRPTRPPKAAKRTPKAPVHASAVIRRAALPKGKHYEAVAPLIVDASKAKPWLERRFGECAYPISGEGAETVSCCQPAETTGYCAAHGSVMFTKPPESAKRLERMAQRYAA
jgi:GcrA cell cycle regulator